MRNNNLSWSYSRATLLYYCAKKYYFNYYTSFLKTFDWDFYKESLILKNLGSMGMWLGNISHGMLSDYLHLVKNNNVNEKTLAELKKQTLLDMDELYEKAKVKDFNEYDKEFKFGFSEHFYGENIDPDFLEGKGKIIRYFDNFMASDIHKEILSYFSPENTVFVEPKLPNFDLMKYQIDNIPELMGIVLWAQPDLGIIIPGKDGKKTRYIIYDWKTGKIPDKDKDTISDQLKIYAYKMLLKLGLDKFKNIEIFCYEVFLQDMTIFGDQIHQSDIQWIEGKIIQDVVEQKKLLVNQNHIKNQPMPVDFFKRTEHKNKCNYCRFRKVCGELENYEQKTARLF